MLKGMNETYEQTTLILVTNLKMMSYWVTVLNYLKRNLVDPSMCKFLLKILYLTQKLEK